MSTFIPEKNWANFKQELPAIICVIGFTIWWRLNFPSNTMLMVFSHIISVGSIIYAFSFPEATAPIITLSFFDKLPEGSILKKISLILISIGTFQLWYTDFYHTSNANYVIALATGIVTYILLYRSVHRNLPKEINMPY